MDEPFPYLGKNLFFVGLLPLLAYFKFLPTMFSYSSLCVPAFVGATSTGLPFPQSAPVCLSFFIKEGHLGKQLERQHNVL